MSCFSHLSVLLMGSKSVILLPQLALELCHVFVSVPLTCSHVSSMLVEGRQLNFVTYNRLTLLSEWLGSTDTAVTVRHGTAGIIRCLWRHMTSHAVARPSLLLRP